MSNQGPGPEPTIEQFEIVGPPRAARPGRSRRYVAVLGVAAVVAAVVGGGLWAWQSWTAQGDQPAKALPADTLAYAALDLDPPGQQKVAAFRTLRKFPTLKKALGLDSADDLSQSVVEKITAQSSCDLDFSDIKPWIGDRVAFAVVAQDKPEPVVVLQVKDADRARAGLKAAGRGCDTKDFGYAVDGDWAVLARNDAVAARVGRDAGRHSLDQDGDFRTLTKAAGDPGLVTLYAAPAAGKALLDEIDRSPWTGWSVLEALDGATDPILTIITGFAATSVVRTSYDEGADSVPEPPDVSPRLMKAEERLQRRFQHFEELTEQEQNRLLEQQARLMRQMYGNESPDGMTTQNDVPDGATAGYDSVGEIPAPHIDPTLRTSLQGFTGLGGVARFTDGALELVVTGDALVGTSADAYAGSAGGELVSRLPADTAVAFGAGLADEWVDALISRLADAYPFSDGSKDKTIAAFEKATGLDVPGDVQALGGDGISIVAGNGFSPDDITGDDFAHLPVAARIRGDAARIESALDKLRDGVGTDAASRLLSRRAGDDVVVGPDADYLDQLAKGGAGLGDSDRFKEVAPQAGDATSVFYLDFDSGDWLAKTAATGDRADAEPLDAFGMTVTKHDGHQRIVLRVSFDD
ncbi:hypothetical protein ACVW00_003012 [Marmoricola sp. URHA0025 HA25]